MTGVEITRMLKRLRMARATLLGIHRDLGEAGEMGVMLQAEDAVLSVEEAIERLEDLRKQASRPAQKSKGPL